MKKHGDKALGEIDYWKGKHDDAMFHLENARAEADALKAERDRLKADLKYMAMKLEAARYRLELATSPRTRTREKRKADAYDRAGCVFMGLSIMFLVMVIFQ